MFYGRDLDGLHFLRGKKTWRYGRFHIMARRLRNALLEQSKARTVSVYMAMNWLVYRDPLLSGVLRDGSAEGLD